MINNFMKKLFLKSFCVAASFTFMFCSNEGRIKERPDDIVPTGPRTEIFQNIMADFPESKNVMVSHPELFESATTKQIKVTSETEVYVTFISEGASYPNTFGWYTYTGSTPATSSDLKLNVLFPHVSGRILKQGDRLQLGEGKIPAGTNVGFFLIINGWDNGAVNFDRETFYTDIQYNPSNLQQHVLFKSAELGDLVLTFEDVRTESSSDQDFNDIIFTVSDNKDDAVATKFNLTGVAEF